MTDSLPTVTIYTDGGCRPNPGPGGWGALLLRPGDKPVELSGSVAEATNNRMELLAAIEALAALGASHRVELVTDSTYLRQGITEWLPRWVANGWKTSARQGVKNRDLWERLSRELETHDVSWRWTRGHAGDRWNEAADRLASAAIPRAPLPVDDPEAVHVFTAVAHSGKRQAGAWGIVLRWEDEERGESERVAGVSANRLHLLSAVAALGAMKRPVPVHLYTVSDYLRDGATLWLGGWKQRGWATRDGKPVSHRDLWQRLDSLSRRHRVEWHVLDKDRLPVGMEYAKQLARDALKLQEP